MSITTISLNYSTISEPDHISIGKIVDEKIREKYFGKHIVIRCLGSGAHEGKSVDELIEIITKLGHDRYDPNRIGDRYENLENKKIEIFGFDFLVEEKTEMFSQFTYGFYHFGAKKNGVPIPLDIILIYDFEKLEQVFFTYEGRENEGQRSDGWIFKFPEQKPEALLGIFKLDI